jgi:hypothetical protein
MSQAELLRLVEEHERAEKRLEASGVAVWDVLVKVEPELASEILQLFSTVDAAARWVVSSPKESAGSPARCVAEGRAGEILSKVRKTAHGFVG